MASLNTFSWLSTWMTHKHLCNLFVFHYWKRELWMYECNVKVVCSYLIFCLESVERKTPLLNGTWRQKATHLRGKQSPEMLPECLWKCRKSIVAAVYSLSLFVALCDESETIKTFWPQIAVYCDHDRFICSWLWEHKLHGDSKQETGNNMFKKYVQNISICTWTGLVLGLWQLTLSW